MLPYLFFNLLASEWDLTRCRIFRFLCLCFFIKILLGLTFLGSGLDMCCCNSLEFVNI